MDCQFECTSAQPTGLTGKYFVGVHYVNSGDEGVGGGGGGVEQRKG